MSVPAALADGGPAGLRTAAIRWTEPGWRGALFGVAVTTVLGAAVPPVRRMLHWPAGLGRRRRSRTWR